jgi:hypothetical protein
MSSLSALLAIAISSSGQVAEETSGSKQLQAWAKDYIGTWEGKATADFDLPGICKKGDPVAMEHSFEWALKGHAVRSKSKYTINEKIVVEDVGLVGWDAAKKRIVSHTHGPVGSGIGKWKKKGDAWILRNRGVVSDGLRHSATVTTVIKDEDTRVDKNTNRKFGDQDLPDIEVVYRRVRKGVVETIEPRYLKYFESLIAKYDKNGDGQLVRDEWISMSKDPEAADADGNGRITAEEYARWHLRR